MHSASQFFRFYLSKIMLVSFFMIFNFSCQVFNPVFNAPTDLRVEFQTNPLGIDEQNPHLSWKITDSRLSAIQSACQVLVASSQENLDNDLADIWDSGKLETDESLHFVYQGPPLLSGKQYFWKVRTWDTEDKPSPYSQAAIWEMGLLSESDWQGQWVGKSIKPQPYLAAEKWPWGYWIWYPKNRDINKPVFFLKSFGLSSGAKIDKALLRITADNAFTAYVNGNPAGAGDSHSKIYDLDVTDRIKPGNNLIAVEAVNKIGDVCGLIASLKIEFNDGTSQVINSDKSWKTTMQSLPDWQSKISSDPLWKNVEIIEKYGEGQWGKIDIADTYFPPRSILVRSDVNLKKSIKRARAYVTGLGNYIMYINGHRVGNDVFTPGWTDYPTRIQYQSYDVTALLNSGENAVGAVLGNMWWSGGLGWRAADVYSEGPLRFLLQLNIEYTDGSGEQVVSGKDWQTTDSPVVENNIYNGETYDAREEQPGWNKPGFDAASWLPVITLDKSAARLVSQQGPTLQITEEITPVSIAEPEPGKYVVDMGQNMVGWVRLRAQGPSGTKVVLRFAETLKADGTIYTDNLRRARATDTYILKGNNEENWEPKFTYHGFRYVEISGFPGVPSKDAILGKVVHSAAPPTIAFNCSNELINRIQKNIVWGQRGNMHSVPTDCPQRDERLGWMGDAQIFAPTASYNMNMARFWRKWVRDIADCQEEDGSVHDVNPAIVVRGPAKPGWGDAVVVVPWVTYHFYGDKRIIEENFDAMAGWVRYMENNSKDYLYERTGYGDWISVVPSPKEPIGAAYFYYSTKLLSEMAGIIGRNDDQIKYLHLSEKIAAAFQKKYYNPQTGQYTGETQTANLLPLAFGITPPSERQRVADNIAGNVRDRGKHPSTGFLGTSYLLPVLSQYGAHPLAYETASQTTYPSWGYMVEKGATTMWELWNSDVAGPGMNSRNHFALGCVGEWFYSRLAGIYPDPNFPGFKQFIIAPKPAGDLTFTEMQLETGYGRISSRWQIADSIFTLDVMIPANTSALVYLPSPEGKKATIAANGVTILVDGTMGKMSEGLTVLSKTDTETGIRAGAGQYHFVVK